MTFRSPSALLIAAATAVAISCTSSGSNPATPSQPTLVSITITGSTSVSAGQTTQLTATATFSDGSTQTVTGSATWSSSNTVFATVSTSGLVSAIAAGGVTITATYQGKSATLSLTVSAPGPFAGLQGTSTWTGTWTDQRYNVSGSLTATFTVNGASVTATGVIGLQSLGLGNEQGTGSGTVSGQTLNFTFSAATVGNGNGTLSANGAGSGSGTVTGSLNLGAFTYQGTVTATTITGTFTFTSPTGGHGVATLTKQ